MSADTFISCLSLVKLGVNPACQLSVDLTHIPRTGKNCPIISYCLGRGSTRESSVPAGCTFPLAHWNLYDMALSAFSWPSKAQNVWKRSLLEYLPSFVWVITGTPNRTTYCTMEACATDSSSWVTSNMISNERVNWSMTSEHTSYLRQSHKMFQACPYEPALLDVPPGSFQDVYFSEVCSDNSHHMWRYVIGHPQTFHTTRISSGFCPVSCPEPDDQLSVHCVLGSPYLCISNNYE